MESAAPLPVKLDLSDLELKGEQVLLSHHSMLTPSDINFSVLRNPTQNFKYRGFLWLTNTRLIYKGFPITKMGANKVSERMLRPFCEIDTKQPYVTIIPISEIADIFVGHDNTFQKRFQQYSKLRITYKGKNGDVISYFYLTREHLLDDNIYINKKSTEWQNKINEMIDKAAGVKPAPPAVPTAPSATARVVGTAEILKEAEASVTQKRFGKIVVKPFTEREKPKFAAIATIVDKEKEAAEAEPAFTKLLDGLVPVSDEEFSDAAADTSIAKCPHCGWILGYSTNKCPRCRKEL
ncbi:MAG: hypothetical protein HWN66_13505 [Candidatus Helarchaeota archaeon]|nr:hypothetical protein [Candidatus Helarchaeota archaeon]